MYVSFQFDVFDGAANLPLNIVTLYHLLLRLTTYRRPYAGTVNCVPSLLQGVLNVQISMRCEKREPDDDDDDDDDNGAIKDIRSALPTNIYSFVSSLTDGIEKYRLSPKDILNIRSEFSTEKLNNPYLIIENIPFLFSLVGNSISPPDFSDYPNLLNDYLNPTTEFFTYLATILIELDPL